MVRFKDKAVVVTGGAGGIGLATIRAFLAEGARVALLDKMPVDPVPAGALPLVLDLTKKTTYVPVSTRSCVHSAKSTCYSTTAVPRRMSMRPSAGRS